MKTTQLRHTLPMCLLLLGSLITCGAQASTMSALLDGNDLRLEYPGGFFVLVSFASDGTYTTNTGSSGTWTLNGDELCTQRTGTTAPDCGTLESGKALGDSWTSTDGNGQSVTASVVAR